MGDIVPSDSPQNKPHYVYVLAYPDGRVFYVGKGQGDRINQHEREARKSKTHNSYKCNVIRKIWRDGGQVVRTILAYFETHEEACMYEIGLIFFLPGLTNQTYGGDGTLGHVVSEEMRQKISEKNKGRTPWSKGKQIWSEEERRGISTRLKGHTHSEEARRKIGEAGKGRQPWIAGKRHTEETRKKMSAAGKGRTPPNKGKTGYYRHSEEHKHKMSEIMKGRPRSEEYRRHISEAQKGKRRSPDTIRKLTEINRRNATAKRGKPGKPHSEETKRKLSAAGKGRTPHNKGKPLSEEQKAKLRVSHVGVKQSPESVAKRALANTGKKRSEESLRRMSEAQKKRQARRNNRTYPPIIWPSDLPDLREYKSIDQLPLWIQDEL